jgi:hypothetical protein
MSARQIMTMRATHQRNYAEKDPYGGKAIPQWHTVDPNLPCKVWETADRKRLDTAVIEVGTPVMITVKTSDLTIDDRIINVIDRRGNVLYAALQIESVILRKDHKAARLKKIA